MQKACFVIGLVSIVVLLSLSGCKVEPVTTTIVETKTITPAAQTITITPVAQTTTVTTTETVTASATTSSPTTTSSTPTATTTSSSSTSSDAVDVRISQTGVAAKITKLNVEETADGLVITGHMAQYDMGTYTVEVQCSYYDSAGKLLGTASAGPWRLEGYGGTPWDFEITFTGLDVSKVDYVDFSIVGKQSG